MAPRAGGEEEVKRAGSYGLAVQLADEWESEVRQAKKFRKRIKWDLLERSLDQAAIRAHAPANGLWNYRDVAKKAVEILQERLGK